MGLFRPIIGKGLTITPEGIEPSDRMLTPANAMTAARPVLAIAAANRLLKGQRPVTPIVFFMGASDAEGNVARFISKIAPNSGLGVSTFGEEFDPVADTAAILFVGSACLRAPRMPVTAKLAVATALGHEGFKAAWALRTNHDYQRLSGERLKIKPTIEGKESMAEKLSAIGMAVLASDFDHPIVRQTLSAGALGFATVGSLRAERQRDIYNTQAMQMMADYAQDA